MPTYEYACRSCGHHLEVAQSFSDEPLTICPNCGGALRKVFGSIGIVLKGSGFYKTDSRPARSEGKAAADTSSKSDTSAASDSKSGSSSGESSSSSGSSAGFNGSSDSGSSAKPAAASSGS